MKSIARAVGGKIWSSIIWGDNIKTKLLCLVGIVLFIIVFGMGIAYFVFNLTPGDALWWSWTHVLDPGSLGDDKDILSRRILGSFFAVIGLVLLGGAFITLSEEAARRTVERLMHGRVPADLSGFNVIAGKSASKLRAFLNALPDKQIAEKVLIITPDQGSLALARKNCGQNVMLGVDQLWEHSTKDCRYKFHNAHRIILLDDFGSNTGDMLKIINMIYDSIKDRTMVHPLEIYAEINNRDLVNTLRLAIREIDHECAKINFHIINIADTSARLTIKEYPLDCIAVRPGSKQGVHLIIEGWTPFAQALFWQALRVAHYPVKPTRIMVCHPAAKKLECEVLTAAPGLNDAWCREHLVNITFEQAFNPSSLNLNDNDLLTLAICSTNPDTGFADVLKFKMSKFPGLRQIYLELPNNSGYRDVIDKMEAKSRDQENHVRIVATGLSEESIDLEEKLDVLAEKIHSHYQKKYDDVKWSRLDEVKRAWNRSPADHVDVKMRIIAAMIKNTAEKHEKDDINNKLKDLVNRLAAYDPKNKDNSLHMYFDILSRIEHDRWCAEKYADGWTYADGPKNNAKKQNPCLMPYDNLPDDEKLKDWETMKVILDHIKTSPTIFKVCNT